jgi:hypothetical protein
MILCLVYPVSTTWLKLHTQTFLVTRKPSDLKPEPIPTWDILYAPLGIETHTQEADAQLLTNRLGLQAGEQHKTM